MLVRLTVEVLVTHSLDMSFRFFFNVKKSNIVSCVGSVSESLVFLPVIPGMHGIAGYLQQSTVDAGDSKLILLVR